MNFGGEKESVCRGGGRVRVCVRDRERELGERECVRKREWENERGRPRGDEEREIVRMKRD